MALQGPYRVDRLGLSLGSAYVKVNVVEILTDPSQPNAVNITYAVYADEGARRSGKAPVDIGRYQVSGPQYDQMFAPAVLDSANPIRQAYLVLRSLDSFKNFADV